MMQRFLMIRGRRVEFATVLRAILCCACLLVCLVVSCAKSGPPTPLALDQIPAALNQAFASSPAERRELVDRALASLQNKEIGKATMVLEGLCAVPDLSKKQREAATRALLCLNLELQAAMQRGDKDAAEVLRLRQIAK
jgi:hypothetical protein